jgi:glycosyltransferase involved in cell wall biosynthesis
MRPISIVIICKNEAHVIGRSLESLAGITDDIVVYDNGSTDGTKELVRSLGVRMCEGPWEGFGKTKNRAIALAKYDWILSLDADEGIDQVLKNALLRWEPGDPSEVYDLAFKNFFGERYLAFGEWGGDHHIRLFNRQRVHWNEAPVHEELLIPMTAKVRKMEGHVLHRTMKDLMDYRQKMIHYAMLGAQKYFEQGKHSNWIKLHLSPGFNFIKFYLFKLGFLDGYAGYLSAKMTAWYTFMKYTRLRELWRQQGPRSLA